MKEELQLKLQKLKVDTAQGIKTYGEDYEDKLKQFINGYDFMRLGQAVNNGRLESAAMCARRISDTAKKLGLEGFQRQFTGLRQNIARKDVQEVKNILSLVIVKRIQIQDALKNS